jgi:hypothetical protein
MWKTSCQSLHDGSPIPALPVALRLADARHRKPRARALKDLLGSSSQSVHNFFIKWTPLSHQCYKPLRRFRGSRRDRARNEERLGAEHQVRPLAAGLAGGGKPLLPAPTGCRRLKGRRDLEMVRRTGRCESFSLLKLQVHLVGRRGRTAWGKTGRLERPPLAVAALGCGPRCGTHASRQRAAAQQSRFKVVSSAGPSHRRSPGAWCG